MHCSSSLPGFISIVMVHLVHKGVWSQILVTMLTVSVAMPSGVATARAAPSTRTMNAGLSFDVLNVLDLLHETSTLRKTRRSLQLHSLVWQACAATEHAAEADRLMINYRANDRVKFHDQTSGDWA